MSLLSINFSRTLSLGQKNVNFVAATMNFCSTEKLVVQHQKKQQKFFVEYQGHEATIDYKQDGDFIAIYHTTVPKAMGGRGVGKMLVKETLKYVRDNDLDPEIHCSFVRSYIEKYEPELKKYLK